MTRIRKQGRRMKTRRLLLPDDDIHDQEVPHQANDTDDQVYHHHGDLDARGQQSLRLIVASIEVVLEHGVVVELQVAQLVQQEVLRERHRNSGQLAGGTGRGGVSLKGWKNSGERKTEPKHLVLSDITKEVLTKVLAPSFGSVHFDFLSNCRGLNVEPIVFLDE